MEAQRNRTTKRIKKSAVRGKGEAQSVHLEDSQSTAKLCILWRCTPEAVLA